jgi:hypothetical protein
MEDHETRRKIIRGWRFRRISDIPKNRLWHSPKRRPSKISSIAVDAIRTTNFGAIRTRKSWDGSTSRWQAVMSDTAALGATDTLHRVYRRYRGARAFNSKVGA